MGARLVDIRGKVQRHKSIIHVVVDTIEDRTERLADLTGSDDQIQGQQGAGTNSRRKDDGSETSALLPLAHADEVARPQPERAPSNKRRDKIQRAGWTPGRHPREERVIPKSRDFH